MKTENISPNLGTIVHVDRSAIVEDEVAQTCLQLLEERAVLVFPRIGLND